MHAEHADGERLNDLSGHMVGCAFTVFNTLGTGFLEKIHENALAHQVRLISANRAWSSNAWPTAGQPRQTICIANLKNPRGLR
jgi:hypothetical protein